MKLRSISTRRPNKTGGRIIPFPDLDAQGIETLIDRSCLADDNRQIARLYLIRGKKLVEIGVDDLVRLDRSTVGKRLRKEVIPELERVKKIG